MGNTLNVVVSKIRNTLLVCLTCMAAAGALLSWAYHRFERDEQKVTSDARAERQARQRLAELNDDMVAAGAHRHEFIALKAEGVLGDLDKTRLLDHVERGLSPFGNAVREYKLEARRDYLSPALAVLQRHRFGQHRLELQFSPIHEIEFLSIWQTLTKNRRGIAPIESCELKRKESGQSIQSGENRALERLEARCVMVAYSIRTADTDAALAATMPMAQTAPPPAAGGPQR